MESDEKMPEEEKAKEVDEVKDDVYTEKGVEQELADDEVTPEEAGFMHGEEDAHEAICANCNKILNKDEDEFIEREFEGKKYWFCSLKCADEYEKKKQG